jgi:hypothetical protein
MSQASKRTLTLSSTTRGLSYVEHEYAHIYLHLPIDSRNCTIIYTAKEL